MTRQEVYNKCRYPLFEWNEWAGKVCVGERVILSENIINAIIDCAVEEAVERMKGKNNE